MFFFFSSRRRHTRCSRDWSSDVCSSDLIFSDLAETIEIGQYQVGALVPGGAPREANRKHLRVQMETGFCANHFEQFMLGDEMGGPHVFGRQTEGTSQTEIVLAPSWDVAVEELSKRGASPRARMDAIRDRFDGYLKIGRAHV